MMDTHWMIHVALFFLGVAVAFVMIAVGLVVAIVDREAIEPRLGDSAAFEEPAYRGPQLVRDERSIA